MNENQMHGPVLPKGGGGSTPQILIVDDDKFVRKIMKKSLEDEGYTLEAAMNGHEAVQILEEFNPDIIISDWMMPEMDGIELCRWVRNHHRLKDSYFILLTAKDRVEDKTHGLDTGADDYITKPFQGAELVARVRSGLRLRRVQKQLTEAYKVLDDEFRVVANIQKSLLPSPLDHCKGYEFGSHYSPSSRAGGDYYDFIRLSDLHLGILVADVSGHGAAASVVMAITRVVMRAFVQQLLSPGGALSIVNDVLSEHVPTDQFETAFYGVLNMKTHKFTYTSAGHNPPLVRRAATGEVQDLANVGGIPLKIMEHQRYEEAEVILEPGDQILLYTDGITEAFDPDQEMFGEHRLIEMLRDFGDLQPASLISEIMLKVRNFVRHEPFHDDITLVSVRRAE
ncbi:MAG: SpoIIE family protein phosphatase [Candidatus Omnitrophica bacterium]|nr:SpoIIE family protein phosphatase [Candidatus Omnitrophota bacterium]MCA9424120.1 SpoIIE family protein phosphatase [Candidatus Omnitrophota bacterium]MCA9434354.1 SpoIIE family protein phosphatase [Candidatus Omnitrophota bacterium]MCA9445897.1 SpoIIE family protein phosphatase [Candidatus Omnitrophota bacterium]